MAAVGKFRAVRGMRDIPPPQSQWWQHAENRIISVMRRYGYREIRLPLIEATDLFHHSVGAHTDIVSKEMYSFTDQGGERLTLRPEGTASCARALLQNPRALQLPARLWYAGPMFRHERPQHGRYRQFFQIGLETFGLPGADIETEVLALIRDCWQELDITDLVTLEINTLGNTAERTAYRQALVAWLHDRATALDPASRARLDTNPLRILDSKLPATRALLDEAPVLSEYLEADSRKHFDHLKYLLETLAIPFRVNPRIVRGLDYYSNTVFEWTTDKLGAQGTICAGGRYDGLMEVLGGPPTPGMGMAIGLDRVLELLMTYNVDTAMDNGYADIYLVPLQDAQLPACLQFADELRIRLPEMRVVCHCGGGRTRNRMKKADQSGARVVLIVGEEELRSGQVAIKPLRADGVQITVPLAETVSHVRKYL